MPRAERAIVFDTLIGLNWLLAGLRCYVCDSRSVIGYYDAEKACNTDRSLQQCPDVKVFKTFSYDFFHLHQFCAYAVSYQRKLPTFCH